jgi:sulfite exporter TauE/SafE
MSSETIILLTTAATIGFVHTVFGPDHYIPFIVISKARKWSLIKTGIITFFCGIGHVLSSVILGFIGIGLGISILKLKSIESFRGDISAWLLIIFGFTYFIWGIHRMIRNKPHSHVHIHEDGKDHSHTHTHFENHSHFHGDSNHINMTAWVLFIIFVFGPCEPLIPLLMYPAAEGSVADIIMVAIVFGLTTVGTMLSLVLLFHKLLKPNFIKKVERYSHPLAGLIILFCGIAILFFGL